LQTAARLIYVLAIGVLVAMTVGFGVVTFIPEPDPPEYPFFPIPARPADGTSVTPTEEEQIAAQEAYDKAYREYEQEREEQRRIALGVTIPIALAFILAGLLATHALDVLRVGLMLGGLFSLIWGLIYAASEAGNGAMFVAALIALIVLGGVSVGPVRARVQSALRLGAAGDPFP
jgi:hypothetical protein